MRKRRSHGSKGFQIDVDLDGGFAQHRLELRTERTHILDGHRGQGSRLLLIVFPTIVCRTVRMRMQMFCLLGWWSRRNIRKLYICERIDDLPHRARRGCV